MTERLLPIVWKWGMCKFPDRHESCYGSYDETTSKDGEPVAEMRCPCECHHWPEDGVPA